MLEKAVKENYVWDIMELLMNNDDEYEKAIDILMDLGFDLSTPPPTEEEQDKQDKEIILGAKLAKYGKSGSARRYGRGLLIKHGYPLDEDTPDEYRWGD